MLRCCTPLSKTPYRITAIGRDAYSLEEINHFIYNHINMVYREFFSENLFSWIEKEAGLRDMADELRRMDAEGATVKDFIKYVLKESGYYTPNDLAQIADYIINIDNMSRHQRMYMEAENLLKEGKLRSALQIFSDILNNMEKEDSVKSFYAKVAFSIGVIYAKMFLAKNANAYFARAYELYPDQEYINACLAISIINGDDAELLRTIVKYKVSDENLYKIRHRVLSVKRDIETGETAISFIRDFESGRDRDAFISIWKQEYYDMLT
ncbi:MAG: hypothetical protein HUJ75_05115 [Parasporobacterium sp.]|nr:hypothetical protein [Parasporobacterium sp.]